MKIKPEILDPRSVFGRTMLVFFWGGLSASIVMAFHYVIYPIRVELVAFSVVFLNMFLVFAKSYLFSKFN